MHKFGRRTFLKSSALSLAPLASMYARAAGSDHLTNIGVQLYTVRRTIGNNPAAVLASIQDEGYSEVEAIYTEMPAILPALQQTKLKPVSVHVEYDIFGSDVEMNKVLDNVKKWGFEYIVPPSMQPAQKNSLDAFKPEIQKLNKAAEQAQKKGLKMCYHNHAFEFQPLNGTTPLELLIKESDPKVLSLETDVFWVSVAGHDPAEFIKRHAGRVALLHLKDKKKGLPPRFNQDVPKDAFKEVGSGSIDFKAVLRAATDAGVKHFFVEQDETERNPLSSLEMSYKYLHQLAF